LPFTALLKELVSGVEGGEGAIFLDADGEAVQWYAKDAGERLRLRAAYIAVMLQACQAASARLGLGRVGNLVVEYDGAKFVIEEIERDYFVMLELNRSANVGQALHRIKPVVAALRREVAA
jgi:predicted regulator of Ras-like GTPase activity (Roadblock/LC7/MglB family)